MRFIILFKLLFKTITFHICRFFKQLNYYKHTQRNSNILSTDLVDTYKFFWKFVCIINNGFINLIVYLDWMYKCIAQINKVESIVVINNSIILH